MHSNPKLITISESAEDYHTLPNHQARISQLFSEQRDLKEPKGSEKYENAEVNGVCR